jgi:hypothetical protein
MNIGYTFGDSWRFTSWQDTADSQRYMRQLYPLASGFLPAGAPGLTFVQRDVFDDGMAARVAQTHEDCERFKDDDARPPVDNRNMCAAAYAGEWIAAVRRMGWIPSAGVWYANIAQAWNPDGSNPFFTRGFSRGDGVCMGPSGPSSNDSYKNYAAHEVGHELGRPHPWQGLCGHSRDDLLFPYIGAAIGDQNESPETRVAGLAIGELFFQPITFVDAQRARDTMSYCGDYWISDYTYERIYEFVAARPWLGVAAAGPAAAGAAAAAIEGDFLVATGSLAPGAGEGGFGVVRRAAAVADDTPPVPGGFTLELRDGEGSVLASHGFTATPFQDGAEGQLAFELVVPFAPGTRELRAVEDATQAVLASRAVSESAPSISDVALPGAPDPVDGMVTVTWTAGDPDGDELHFDLFTTQDGGASFRPIQLSIEGTVLELDSTRLPGGINQLRIVATDGVQVGEALSEPFTVAGKPPQVVIQSPQDGASVQWDQLVRFEAAAADIQDDEIPDESFVWSNAYGELGTGRVLETRALQVGVNPVTVEVTNSLGLSAQALVTVVVGDVLTPLPPTLSVVPAALAFDVTNDETLLQPARLEVWNAGAGALAFDVSSDSGWLTIDGASAHSGAPAPSFFTIEVDPTLVPPGVTSTATLTFQSLANPADVFVVPVALSKGNVFEQTGATDFDQDGVFDVSDNCRSVANADQDDGDGDGVGSACDNCIDRANPLLVDSDRDGHGNACDADYDQNGSVGLSDFNRFRAMFGRALGDEGYDPAGDANDDDRVGLPDFNLLRQQFGGPPGPSAPAAP